MEKHKDVLDESVPQNVKQINAAWAREDKISRHIDDHLNRHLKLITEKVRYMLALSQEGKIELHITFAEERLKEVCDIYAGLIDRDENKLSGLEVTASDTKKILSSDSHRRELHNKIAIMVVGKQRSGMDDILARKIANFAYEYSRGYKIGEKDKYKN